MAIPMEIGRLDSWLRVAILLMLCPLLGGLPLINWIFYARFRRPLAQQGTGNISVSAAFYHGGNWMGILAVASEAFKGIAAVLLARSLFPGQLAWELIALIALVMGRYLWGKGAGTTNVVWGVAVHDPVVAGLVLAIGGISFTILRERKLGRLGVLVLLPVVIILLYPYQQLRAIAAMGLSLLLAWIYHQIPDDLDLSPAQGKEENKAVFRFFRGDRALLSLDNRLDASQVGEKAATLSHLKRQGYAVPSGWVLPAGDDLEPLIEALQPSGERPLIVRSSAIGEDSLFGSAAGQYKSIANITNSDRLRQAIITCLNAYNLPNAIAYRETRNLPEKGMGVLVQQQIKGVFSGVAFSRDPVNQQSEEVLIEALPGDAERVVSGQFTPEQFRILVTASETRLTSASTGDVPPHLIEEVAQLARQLEERDRGVPQDVEWTYDGQQIWILQARPIVTALPIWTRKIAAEVIPGTIRPLTWSINRPLTCGVWGDIFRIVLGDRVSDLNFNQTATLHFSRAYFNASLLGEIFLKMGLPPESLEFLTRGAKFTKPPLLSTLRQIPGLLRLLREEWLLEQNFEQDDRQMFAPLLFQLQLQTERPLDTDSPNNPYNALASDRATLNPQQLLDRIEVVLDVLKRATYYSILTPLSVAVRQAVLKVKDKDLDTTQLPEIEALLRLSEIATAARHLLPELDTLTPQTIFGALSEVPDGQTVVEQFDQFLETYGYLSEVATDIAIPRWKEDPRPVRSQFALLIANLQQPQIRRYSAQRIKVQLVQSRLNLKGKVAQVYNRSLAELRWSFIAIEQQWIESRKLETSGDIFFLNFGEIRRLISDSDPELSHNLLALIAQRKAQFKKETKLPNVPPVVYGNAPSIHLFSTTPTVNPQTLQGIGASAGQVEGNVQIVLNLQTLPEITQQTILVVPYTDAGWSPLLARAGGLIAEVGGRLSHGAIVAREYGIPAVMDIHDATRLLKTGQRVRIDGLQGIVEILD
ncbi:MAG: glycerol-3-phosphate acyltransferase [Desertifilum sp.]|nr:glycerol-3-phosphate acyltransferase [Desertifilum sp.]